MNRFVYKFALESFDLVQTLHVAIFVFPLSSGQKIGKKVIIVLKMQQTVNLMDWR